MNPQPATPVTLQIVSSLTEVTKQDDPRFVDFTVLQLNDVYEAAPVEGGRLGGLARVATLRRRLAAENPNLLSVMVGDFLSPSPIGATTGDSGQHMVEALNAVGLTHATVGNHEFDLPQKDLLQRIADSRFKWVVSNVTDGNGQPFPGTIRNDVVEFANAAGNKARVALIGVCLDMVKLPWIKYQDPIETAKQQVTELTGRADVFLAMTHLVMAHDMQLGEQVARIDVLLGGHEHQAATAVVGADATPIFKADSNARTALVHRFRFDPQSGVSKLYTQVVPIDASIPDEPETAAIIKRWETITYDTLRAQGSDPQEIVGTTQEVLQGYEAQVRGGPTNLTQLIVDSFLQEVPDADAVIFPAGQVRLDGVISPGDITYFDIVRIFPVGGKLSVLTMPGPVVRSFLDRGEAAKGTGAYQARANVSRDGNGAWLIKGAPIRDDSTYKIVFTEVPVAMLAYPPFKGTGVVKCFDTREVRAILSDRLRRDRARLAQQSAQQTASAPDKAPAAAPPAAAAAAAPASAPAAAPAPAPAGTTAVVPAARPAVAAPATPAVAAPASAAPAAPSVHAADAEKIIRKHALAAAAAGVVPVPVLDFAMVAGAQLNMVRSLARLYEVPFEKQLGKSIIASLVGGSLSNSLWGLATLAPLLGMVGISAAAAASTYGVGRVFVQHFESGGTFLTLDPDKVRDYYAQKVSEARPAAPVASATQDFTGIKP